MKSNATTHMTCVVGETFSHSATSPNYEKIVSPPAIPPVLPFATADGVTLMSKSDHPCPAVEKMRDEFEYDLQHLTKMQLRTKFPAEANSHRNMLTRSKRRGNKVHPALREFRSFLRLVGPMPVSGATLDRIDNTDREYAPGKVRWADKRTQNNNKSDTLTIYDQHTGEVFTASRLAKLQGVAASTIRKRLARGWADAEIIAGVRFAASSNNQKQVSPLPSADLVEPPKDLPRIVRARSRSAKEIQFERMAEEIAFYREHYGVEEMLAPPISYQ